MSLRRISEGAHGIYTKQVWPIHEFPVVTVSKFKQNPPLHTLGGGPLSNILKIHQNPLGATSQNFQIQLLPQDTQDRQNHIKEKCFHCVFFENLG